MLRLPLRHRRPLIAVTLLIGAIIGAYAWHHRIPNVTSALGPPPPPEFHDPRLDTPLTITFNGVKFTQAIQQIADLTHVPITVDASLLTDEFPSDADMPVYFHAHQLPARLVIEHLMRQVGLHDYQAACVESPAGLQIVPFEQTLAKATTHTFDVSAVVTAIVDHHRSPWRDRWSAFIAWVKKQFDREPSYSIFAASGSDELYTPRADSQAELANVLPVAPPGWWTLTHGDGELIIRASADHQCQIYQMLREVYLGLRYHIDSRRLHPVSETRRHAMTWLASQPGSWKQPWHQPMQWLQQAERDGVCLSIHMPLGDAAKEPVVWLVDEHGVVIAGIADAQGAFRVPRTYDISDLIHNDPSTPRPDQVWEIMQAIETHVDPGSWVPDGLIGLIESVDDLLIVSAPPDTHDHLAEYLAKLRETKK